jgi:hypothetical protein
MQELRIEREDEMTETFKVGDWARHDKACRDSSVSCSWAEPRQIVRIDNEYFAYPEGGGEYSYCHFDRLERCSPIWGIRKVWTKPYAVESMGPVTEENARQIFDWVKSHNVTAIWRGEPPYMFWIDDSDHPDNVMIGSYVVYDPEEDECTTMNPAEFLTSFTKRMGEK